MSEIDWGPHGETAHLASGFDASITDIFVDFDGRISRLDPLAPGVTLILGKNGSGKSSLLQSIEHFGTQDSSKFPEITLRFQLPSVEETLSFWDFVESHYLDQMELFERLPPGELGFEERRRYGLPIVEAIIHSLDSNYQGFITKIDEKRYSPVNLLRHFDISEAEISAFEARQARHARIKVKQPEPNDYKKLNYRDYFCEFFLSLVRSARVVASETDEKDLEEEFNWDPDVKMLYGREWLRDSKSRARLVAGLREVFETGIIDVSGLNRSPRPHHAGNALQFDDCCIRFVGNIRDGSVLRDLSKRFSEKISEHNREHPLFHHVGYADLGYEQVQVFQPIGFPYDLFTESKLRADEVVTLPFLLRQRSQLFAPFQHSASPFVATRSLPGIASAADCAAVLKSLTSWQSNAIINHHESAVNDSKEDADILIGMQAILGGGRSVRAVLTSASEILRKLDIGISELQLNLFVNGQHVLSQNGPWASQDRIMDDLSLIFRSSPGASWEALEHASDGQVMAVFIVLQLLTILDPLKSERLKSAVSILVADEFDRHLHPTTAEALLAEMHTYARRAGVSVLVSTHSVPLFRSHLTRSCPRLYSVRDVDATFEVRSEPNTGLFGIASLLGTSETHARSTVKLHLVVEGAIDECILKKLFFDPRIPDGSVEILTLSGIRNLEGVWRSSLKYLTAPILVVYDKQSDEFEKIWNQQVRHNPVDFIEQQNLRRLELALISRKNSQRAQKKKLIEGDEELEALLGLARSVLDSQRVAVVRHQVDRLRFFGLKVPDILWCLPIDLFKRSQGLDGPQAWVPESVESWSELLAASGRDRLTGTELKTLHGINLIRVEAVLRRMDEKDLLLNHPDLLNLLATVIGLIEIHEDPTLGI